MKKSGESQIAARYVSALFDVVKQASGLAAVEKNLSDLASAQTSGSLDALLSNPLLTRAQQADTIAALSDKIGAHALTKAFLVTLARQRRLALLAEIARQFAKKAEEDRGEISAHLVTAAPMSAEELSSAAERLAKALGKKINVSATQDKALLGGLVVSIGSLRLDASLAGKLERLEQRLKAA